MKRSLTILILVAMLLAVLAGVSLAATLSASGDSYEDPFLRIGLYYGDDAKDGANLENTSGNGFVFGYFGDDNILVPLASYSGSDAISVVKTENVYYGTYNSYTSYHDNLTNSSIAVGCYHLELPDTYSSFEEACAAAEQHENGFVAYISGVYYVRIGNYLNREAAATAQESLAAKGVSAEIKGTSSYAVSVVVEGTNTILFQYDDEGAGTGLGVEAIPAAEGEKTLTAFIDTKWYGSFRFERISGGDLTIVNVVRTEDYIKGVISREMSASWPLEALKAQAVCARTYALNNLNRHNKAYHFDICRKTHCQAYWGISKSTANSDRAVEECRGQVATYNGKLITCVYYSSNGGASEGSSLVWGSKQSAYPYLVGVVDPFESTISISSYNWTRTYTGDELATILQSNGYGCSTIVSVRVSSYSATGNPAWVTFKDGNGKEYTISARNMIKYFSFRSYRYDLAFAGNVNMNVNGDIYAGDLSLMYAIDEDGNLVPLENPSYIITGDGTIQAAGSGQEATGDSFTFVGRGYGHNVGMSQYGAYAMAKLGYSYDEILKFYYTGISVGYY